VSKLTFLVTPLISRFALGMRNNRAHVLGEGVDVNWRLVLETDAFFPLCFASLPCRLFMVSVLLVGASKMHALCANICIGLILSPRESPADETHERPGQDKTRSQISKEIS